MKKHYIAIDDWNGVRRYDVFGWLEENYGPIGIRWNEHHDYGFINLEMNEDVYIMYTLRWGK